MSAPRWLALMLTAFLLAIGSPASASQVSTYAGTNSQEQAVEFDVERRDVLTLTRYDITTTQMCDDGSTVHGHRAVAAWPEVKRGVALNGDLLWLREGDGTSEVVFINGKVGDQTASGELEVEFKNGSVSCRSDQVFWTAERVRSTTTGWIYRGRTSQGETIRFRIELQERALVLTAYRFYFTETCEDGTTHSFGHLAGLEGLVFVGRSLHLSSGDGYRDIRIDGRFRAGTASGTLETNSYPTLDDLSVIRCTTGELTWTAERVPRMA